MKRKEDGNKKEGGERNTEEERRRDKAFTKVRCRLRISCLCHGSESGVWSGCGQTPTPGVRITSAGQDGDVAPCDVVRSGPGVLCQSRAVEITRHHALLVLLQLLVETALRLTHVRGATACTRNAVHHSRLV